MSLADDRAPAPKGEGPKDDAKENRKVRSRRTPSKIGGSEISRVLKPTQVDASANLEAEGFLGVVQDKDVKFLGLTGSHAVWSLDEYSPETLSAWRLALRKARDIRRLTRWNDLLPSPGLRKQTGKMLADQAAHIAELTATGREGAATWQLACTYLLWCWYVLKRPITTLSKTLQGKVGS